MQTKKFKRTISAALILAMLVMMMLPMSVPAATKNYQFKTLSAGKWATESYKYNYDTGIHYTYYKITVKKAGRLNFTLSDDGWVYIYTNATDIGNGTVKKGSRKSVYYGSDSKMVAVEKGTYYLDVSDGKCKYSFTAVATPTNYCMAKATTLKANKAAYNVFTPKTNFSRWYKITNPKKKKIVFWTNDSDYSYSIRIFNSKLKCLETVKNGSDVKYCTKAAQAKGTYYIRVQCQSRYGGDNDYAFGDVVTLKWK